MPKYTIDTEKIDNDFTYHPPFGNQVDRFALIRNTAKGLAFTIAAQVPDSREKSLAMTNLEQAVFWANAAIARNEKPETTE